MFDLQLAREIARGVSNEENGEQGLIESFAQIGRFIADNPKAVSKSVATLASNTDGLKKLATRYFKAYRKTNIPSPPSTVPDDMVDVVMQEVYKYSREQCREVKLMHQHAMSAENCVGALLERYLDSVLRSQGWHWCCGNIVRAVDFIHRQQNGHYSVLQIKNRDNSENSSSSAIRTGTEIQKWFRTFSRTGKTNWDDLPPLMQGHGLDEIGFVNFVRGYLRANRKN